MRILAGLRLGVPGLPCLNPAGPGVVDEVGVGAVLRFSKSNATPSGVFNETVTFLGTNDDEVAFRVFVVEDGVEGDGANPLREEDWCERGGGGIGA